jgi:hypothetical protein
MLATVGNTLQLIKISWRVLRRDSELVLFPVMQGVALLSVFAYVAVAFGAAGTFGRLENSADLHAADVVFLLIAYFAAAFVVVYFNTALVAAAHYRLTGGDPDIGIGLDAANDRLGTLVIWAAISATVALILRQFVEGRGIISRIAAGVIGALWAWATFFVIPIIVIENAGPLDALERSTELFRATWGKQFVANFGFGLAYVALFVVAALPAVGFFLLTASPVFAVIVGVFLFLCGVAVLKAMETIFTVALYNYAVTGRGDGDFPEETLRGAYVPREERGPFSPTGYWTRKIA